MTDPGDISPDDEAFEVDPDDDEGADDGPAPLTSAERAALDERMGQIHQDLARRWPEDRIAPTLTRVERVMQLLGDPQQAAPAIHIAGTNGKTSTVRMVDALLRAFGLSVGRTTSPHLVSVTERIVINGEPIDTERFVRVYDDITPYLQMVDAESIAEGGPALSTFEALVCTAFATFADAPVDASVVEVGMGGAWDATNVVHGEVAVITPIGLDHADYLGDTIAAVASEKAGVIKSGGVAVIAGQDPEALDVLLDRCVEQGVQAAVEGRDFGIAERKLAVGGQLLALQGLGGRYDEIFLPLHGAHQAQNAAVALAAVEAFLGGGQQRLDPDVIRDGFAAVSSPGRLEVLRRSPTLIVDSAHNPHGVAASLEAVREAFDPDRLVVVLGMLADKDIQSVIELLEPVADAIIVTEPSSRRAFPSDELAEVARDALGDDRVIDEPEPSAALEAAVTVADEPGRPPGIVLVIGSVVLAGQVRQLLGAP